MSNTLSEGANYDTLDYDNEDQVASRSANPSLQRHPSRPNEHTNTEEGELPLNVYYREDFTMAPFPESPQGHEYFE